MRWEAAAAKGGLKACLSEGRSPVEGGQGGFEYLWNGFLVGIPGPAGSLNTVWEESTNAHLNFKKTELARDCGARAGGATLVIDKWSRSAAKRNGRGRKRTAVRDRVLLQSEVGPRGRIPGAFQEEPLPGSEKRDRAGAHAKGEHDCSALSHH